MTVAYYDDALPEREFIRTLEFPLTINKANAIALIRQKGAEIRGAVTLNSENVIGQIISIP